jgi:hypothetical protein
MQFVFFCRLFVFLLYPWCFNVSSWYGSLHSQGFSLPLDLGNFLLFFHRYNLINFFLFFMSFFRGGEVDIKSDLILIWSIQHYRNFKINFKLHLWIWALVIFPKKLIFLSLDRFSSESPMEFFTHFYQYLSSAWFLLDMVF